MAMPIPVDIHSRELELELLQKLQRFPYGAFIPFTAGDNHVEAFLSNASKLLLQQVDQSRHGLIGVEVSVVTDVLSTRRRVIVATPRDVRHAADAECRMVEANGHASADVCRQDFAGTDLDLASV